MTAIGHFSLISETELNPSIISFVMGLSGTQPLTAREFADLWKHRGVMERHQRFHQKIWNNRYFIPKGSREDDDPHPVHEHLFETAFPYREDLVERLRLLQTTKWDLSDSLWRIWIAPWGELGSSGCVDRQPEENFQRTDNPASKLGESLILFQGHHALADGASMSAAFLDVVDEAEELRNDILQMMQRYRKTQPKKFWARLWRLCKSLTWLVAGTIRALFHQVSLYWDLLWDKDPWIIVQAAALEKSDAMKGRRTLSWCTAATLEQVKWVAQVLGDGSRSMTVNDVFCSCISAAIARQLNHHRQRMQALTQEQKCLPPQRHIHLALPVHLKGGVVLPGESVGNNLGAFVVRVPGESTYCGHTMTPEQRCRAVHDELVTIKTTPIALLSHGLAKCLSFSSHVLPKSWIASIFTRANAGSIAVVSNNRGLPVHVHLGGRRIESMYGFVPLPQGIPIGVVVMSYAGRISLTLSAESWAVPDADQFLVWVLDEYLNLLEAAKQKARTMDPQFKFTEKK